MKAALVALALLAGCTRHVRPNAGPPGLELYVSAHEDDDLLFMSPDLQRSIRSGRPVRTVYLTAGDAGLGEDYWRARETGIRAAYALMAGVADAWAVEPLTVAGVHLAAYYLRGRPQVGVVFVRLPDGAPTGVGFSRTGRVSLERLWRHGAPAARLVDGTAALDRSRLLALVRGLISRYAPNEVATLDPSGETFDHSDHTYTARIVLAAVGHLVPVRTYQGYGAQAQPPNLSAAEQLAKWRAFLTYAVFDSELCGRRAAECLGGGRYEAWTWRQYRKARRP